VNISSSIVHARPGAALAVRQALGAIDGVEVHAEDDHGRLIVTIETDDDRSTADTFEAIGRLPGVLTVAMVYHRTESNPDMPVATAA
jgi:nitrate reductase NapD